MGCWPPNKYSKYLIRTRKIKSALHTQCTMAEITHNVGLPYLPAYKSRLFPQISNEQLVQWCHLRAHIFQCQRKIHGRGQNMLPHFCHFSLLHEDWCCHTCQRWDWPLYVVAILKRKMNKSHRARFDSFSSQYEDSWSHKIVAAADLRQHVINYKGNLVHTGRV